MLLALRLQEPHQVLPHPLRGGNAQSLLRGVNIIHIRSKGNAVQIRDLGGQDTALQTGMDRLNPGVLAVHSRGGILRAQLCGQQQAGAAG